MCTSSTRKWYKYWLELAYKAEFNDKQPSYIDYFRAVGQENLATILTTLLIFFVFSFFSLFGYLEAACDPGYGRHYYELCPITSIIFKIIAIPMFAILIIGSIGTMRKRV